LKNLLKIIKKISDDWIIDEWYKSAIAGPTIVVN
jgi:hypothetical protein